MPSDDLPVTCQSDQEGKFTVGPMRPGRYQVVARLEGHVLLDARRFWRRQQGRQPWASPRGKRGGPSARPGRLAHGRSAGVRGRLVSGRER